MNVIYLGLENSVRIAAEGVAPEQLRVEGRGVGVRPVGCGRYVVTAQQPGRGALRITAPGWTDTVEAPLRIKRIPYVEARLGAGLRGGDITRGTFRAQGGIAALVVRMDIDAKCDMLGFDVSWKRPGQDAVELRNQGARWNPPVNDLIERARPGDVYLFDNIRCRCLGDAAARDLGALFFRIK